MRSVNLFVVLTMISVLYGSASSLASDGGCKTSVEIECCAFHQEQLGCADIWGNTWLCDPGGSNEDFWHEISASSGWSEATYSTLPTSTKYCTGRKVIGCGTYQLPCERSEQRVDEECTSKKQPTDPEDCP